eukprot:gene56936-biopygen106826
MGKNEYGQLIANVDEERLVVPFNNEITISDRVPFEYRLTGCLFGDSSTAPSASPSTSPLPPPATCSSWQFADTYSMGDIVQCGKCNSQTPT